MANNKGKVTLLCVGIGAIALAGGIFVGKAVGDGTIKIPMPWESTSSSSSPQSSSEPQLVGTVTSASGLAVRRVSTGVDGTGHSYAVFAFTVLPATATNQNVTAAVAWTGTGVSGSASDFVTLAVDQGAKTVKATCLTPFAHQVTLTITSASNAAAKATLTLDYAVKVSSWLGNAAAVPVAYGKNVAILDSASPAVSPLALVQAIDPADYVAGFTAGSVDHVTGAANSASRTVSMTAFQPTTGMPNNAASNVTLIIDGLGPSEPEYGDYSAQFSYVVNMSAYFAQGATLSYAQLKGLVNDAFSRLQTTASDLAELTNADWIGITAHFAVDMAIGGQHQSYVDVPYTFAIPAGDVAMTTKVESLQFADSGYTF